MADPAPQIITLVSDVGGDPLKTPKTVTLSFTGPESYIGTAGEDFVLEDIEDFPIGYVLACPMILPEQPLNLTTCWYDAENEKMHYYSKVTKDAAAAEGTGSEDYSTETFIAICILK